MLIRAGRAAARIAQVSPWTNVYGLARTLMALGTLGTLLFSHSSSVFRPAQGMPDYPNCSGLARFSIFCLVPDGQLELARFLSIGLLLLVVIGWRPRFTALGHWWVTVSFMASATIPDGGDQISAVITLLLLPIALLDGRRWHWGPPAAVSGRPVLTLFAWTTFFVIRLQVAGLYFQASVAKLSHAEWADGTGLWYWLTDPFFGMPGWARPWLTPILIDPVGVTAMTWGPLVIEFALALGMIARRPVRPYLLAAGLAFHLAIGLLMGLGSFMLAMHACLILFLRPVDLPIRFSRLAEFVPSKWARAARPAPGPRAEEETAGPDGPASDELAAAGMGGTGPASGGRP
ncbi:Sporulation-delaying protein SdpB [Nonomuraea coxensis DSM 45129]|uniref:Sporulation-delaying protein SdpB n=1 Tax=Nonomuraea coxensis DSM 45129 TaxID=1122611 RepID=A0ABX8TZW3_9ACTN|nr:sporulation-delaying protein SdpB family protein [Nonomuraea coxensis]QYC40434.1 Sporulation-delaying protein SdpB [Nonomuraea coxensis DSM 45129]